MICGPGRSRVHSAHIGRDCVIHYRWHAYFGRQVGLEAIEQRADGFLASVEVEPELIIKIPTWMLDPASCAGMEIGAPRASRAALAALHKLLVDQGFRQSSPDDGTVSGEELDDVFACTGAAAGRAPAPGGGGSIPAGSTTTGTNPPCSRYRRRQLKTWLAFTSLRRATSETDAPGW